MRIPSVNPVIGLIGQKLMGSFERDLRTKRRADGQHKEKRGMVPVHCGGHWEPAAWASTTIDLESPWGTYGLS